MKVIAGWVVGLMVIVGIGVAVEAGVGRWNYLSTATIEQIALKAAAGAGDPTPTSVTWVRIDNDVGPGGCSFQGCLPPEPHGTTYILEVEGAFFDGFTQVQVTVFLNNLANPMIAAERGFGPGMLTGFGTTETDSLVGLAQTGGSG